MSIGWAIVIGAVAAFALDGITCGIMLKNGALTYRTRKERQSEGASEEEIKDIVADASELLDDEKRMIHEVMDLGDMRVREIMTPRVDMILAEDTDNVRTVLERMRGTGYSRLPVFHEDGDTIVGIVHFKDLLDAVLEDREDDPVTSYLFEAMFVPETKEVLSLLSEMQTARQQMAIVVDEYGGTGGLISVEDIVEEIVGEIADESDLESTDITQLGEGSWQVDGSFPIEDAVALGWPVEDSDDYETLAGWLLEEAGAVPRTGDVVTKADANGCEFRFRIVKMRRRRISAVRVTREEA